MKDTGKTTPVVLVRATAATVVLIGVLATLVHLGATQMIHHRGPLTTADRLKATNDARALLVQLLAAVGLFGGLVYTARTFGLTRHTQRADRFTKAVGQVGDKDSETARTGGVYGLWLLTQEADWYWPPVEQVLTALVRERAVSDCGPDVQAAMTVLGRRPARSLGQDGPALDLRGVHLRGASLVRANLEWVRLDQAHLEEADLTDANLAHATLGSARLERATLSCTNLRDADLSNASARGATFYMAILTGATVSDCDITDAVDLTDAQLGSALGTPKSDRP
jgi:hypothetical protein